MSRYLKPESRTPAWDESPAVERFHNCKMMLHIHGFITEAENQRIKARMLKWVEKHQLTQSGERTE